MVSPLEVHNLLLRVSPTQGQQTLYTNPHARGVSSANPDVEIVDATLIYGMAQSLEVRKYHPTFHPTLVFTPDSSLILARVEHLGRALHQKLLPDRKYVQVKRAGALLQFWLTAIRCAPITNWKKLTPPDRWMSLGYTQESLAEFLPPTTFQLVPGSNGI